MSIKLTSLVWEIAFPSPTQKLIMLRIADYADDKGDGVYPSIDFLSDQVGSKKRQTQYALRALESVALLSKIREGGKGSGKTNIWTIDVELLVRLARQELVLQGNHESIQTASNEGANIAPRTLKRVQILHPEGCNTPYKKGANIAPQGAIHRTSRVQPTAPNTSEETSVKANRHAAAFSIEKLMEEIWQATGGCMMDDYQDTGIVKSWMNAGAHAQTDIIGTIKAIAAKKQTETVEHYGFFNVAVREAIEDRKQGRPNRHTQHIVETPQAYMARRLAEEAAKKQHEVA